MKYYSKFSFIYFLLFFVSSIFSDSFNYMHIQRLLKENRSFLEFINAPVSNFGNAEYKQLFHKAFYHHFKAQKSFLASKYKDSFIEIRRSQKIQMILFEKMLIHVYHYDTRKILELSAPKVIQSRDARAQSFIKLGFRDLKVSEEQHTLGKNINYFLFSSKIKYYMEGIKFSRQAKKLAFLSLIEVNISNEEKDHLKKQTLDDYLYGKKETDGLTQYKKNKNRMINLIEYKLIQDRYNYLLHHDDNFSFIQGENILFKYENEIAKDFRNKALEKKKSSQ